MARTDPGTMQFSQWRPMVVVIALEVVIVVALYEFGLGGPELWGRALAEWAQPRIGDWAAEFSMRVFADLICFPMLIWIIAVGVVGLLQIATLSADRRLIDTGAAQIGSGGRVLRAMGGRSRVPDTTRSYLDQSRAFGADYCLGALRFGVAAFPMVGFIGTIVGLSGAIKNLPQAIGNPELLQPVLDNLNVAFDTTLLGLCGAILSLLLLRIGEGIVDTTSAQHEK